MDSIFILLFLVLFPFGQIIRIGLLQPLDVVVGAGALYAVLRKFKKPEIFKHIEGFLFVFSFSWIFGSLIFRQIEILYGLLYLIRLFAYFYFFIYVWNFAKGNDKNKKLLVDSLLSVSIISAILGWLQFFTFPDLKPFFIWGWDMHLFRLAGTFLDPTFLGLIIVFGLLVSIHRWIDSKSKSTLFIIIFLLVSLAFTYSRAGYLSFFAGLLVIATYKKFIKKALLVILVFASLVFLLPTSRNHSIELLRSISAIARVENYQTTLKIFSKSPVFGVGFDNMCIAYQKYIGFQSFSSHACSGSDSSLLLILATTGIVGLIVLAYSVQRIAYSLSYNTYYLLLITSFMALLVHSLFSNSMFYPWIMGWIVILLAVNDLRSEG